MLYRPRAADQALQRALNSMGGVLLQGPRGCGKTTTALQQAASSVRLDATPALMDLASLDPKTLLDGPTPRLIDEWQLAPTLWNSVRHEIDERRSRGEFILSGSAQPKDDTARHSGAGRIARVTMRTMALSEMGQSAALFSLDDLADHTRISGRSPLSYREMAEIAVIGGWPALLDADARQGSDFNRSYVDDLCSTAIPLATGVRHDRIRLRRLIASVARNTATEVTLESLVADVSADGGLLDRRTVRAYLDGLAVVFALEEVPSWSVALRSRSRLRRSPKMSLTDPALACAALAINSQRLAQDPEFFGQIFESMVTRDLSVAIGAMGGSVYHYRDNTGLEVDVILEFATGTWAAVEVKLGEARLAEAEHNLLHLTNARVDLDRVGPPAFLAIVTAAEYAYTLPSGVHVVPLATLKV